MTSFQIKIYSTQVLSSTDRGSRHMDHDIIMSCREVAVKDQVKNAIHSMHVPRPLLSGQICISSSERGLCKIKIFLSKIKRNSDTT